MSHAATPRTYVMCRPTFFDVSYAINAWMDPDVDVSADAAIRQWDVLRDLYRQLGHTVHELEPAEGLPDMVFAANGAFSVGGTVYGARFKYPQRVAEADAHAAWYEANGWDDMVRGTYVNEGEGDFTYAPARELVLAGFGFRTDRQAHDEAAKVLDREVLSLELVDERFYHLDVALFVLDDDNVCYYPDAFSLASQEALRARFPDALIATEEDALAFGLNAVSDGRHVVLPVEARRLADAVADRGYEPLMVDLAELRKGGGSVKCCTAELRS
jgi:N-dimethylarginine dimethylaminohydrolase